jgi:hypothetical protein
LKTMQRTNFMPLSILVILLAPLLVYAFCLFIYGDAFPLWTWWIGYYIVLLAGPFLIGYGMMVYPRKQHRLLAWIAFVVGGGLTGVFLWLFVTSPLKST